MVREILVEHGAEVMVIELDLETVRELRAEGTPVRSRSSRDVLGVARPPSR